MDCLPYERRLLWHGSIHPPHHNRSRDYSDRRIHCNYSLLTICLPLSKNQPYSSQSFEQRQWWLWLAEELPKSSSSWKNAGFKIEGKRDMYVKNKQQAYCCSQEKVLSLPSRGEAMWWATWLLATHRLILHPSDPPFKANPKELVTGIWVVLFTLWGNLAGHLQLQETPFKSCMS